MPPPPPSSTEYNVYCSVTIGSLTYDNNATFTLGSGNETFNLQIPELELTSGSTIISISPLLVQHGDSITFEQTSNPILQYSHGSTKLIQPDSNFY